MSKVRKFSLVVVDNLDNEIDRFNLDTVQSPSGLGFQINFNTIEDTVITILSNPKENRVAKRLNLIFKRPHAYQKVDAFRLFLESHINDTILLEYDNTVHVVNIEGKITQIDQTELNQFEEAVIPIQFMPTTPKFRKRVNEITIEESNTGLTFPFSFPFAFGSNLLENNILTNNYFQPIPVSIRINGPIDNPQITLTNQLNNTIYSTISTLNLSLTANEHFIIDSANKKVLLFRNNVYVNGYDFIDQDATKDTFIYAQERTTTELNINISAGTNASATGSYREYVL